MEELNSYQSVMEKIVNETINGTFKGVTWSDLKEFINKYGPRFTGSGVLNSVAHDILNESRAAGFSNIGFEEVKHVPVWKRGSEYATLIHPRVKKLEIMGMVNSNGTLSWQHHTILHEGIVVDNIEELLIRLNEISGKIVILNNKFITYNSNSKITVDALDLVSTFGGIALLVRSMTPMSLYSPHTGVILYKKPVGNILVACITAEDAAFLERLQLEGHKILIYLKMEAHKSQNITLHNVIVDIAGSRMPNKTVLISGYFDSMDVGEGVLSASGGVMIPWTALKLLKHLELKAKRTIK